MLYSVRYYREVSRDTCVSWSRILWLMQWFVDISPEWRKSVSGIKNLCNA